MINLEILTQEDIEYICNQISLPKIRQYFQKNQKSFTEIKPGFRPGKVSIKDAVSLLYKYVNKPFIAIFLDDMLSSWLKQIQEDQNQLVGEGYSEEEALLLIIPESAFCDNCELYFKLTERSTDEDYLHLFREALSLRQKETEARISELKAIQSQRDEKLLAEANKTIKGLEEKLIESKQAETRISELKAEQSQRGEKLLAEANKTILDLKEKIEGSKQAENKLLEELSLANSQLVFKDNELEKLQSILKNENAVKSEMQDELEHYRHLSNYSDEYVQDEDPEFRHVSIGEVYHNKYNELRFKRLADIVSGEIIPFVSDKSAPNKFDNRETFHWDEEPKEDGTVGVWSWIAEPYHGDPNKDYVKRKYNHYSKFIEVIEFPQCKTLPEVVNILTEWFEKSFNSEKVLFVCTTTIGIMEGVLCTAENMEIDGGKARLLASVFVLRHYTIKPSDLIKIGGLRIYRKMSLGNPQSIYRVRDPHDVVKKMLLSRVTIPALRETGLTKKEAQKCKHFLESIPTDTLVQDLSDAYACTEAEANKYINSFIEHADTYLSENDIDINIISLAIERNAGLVEICKKQLSEEWEKEYSDKIEEAKKRIVDAEQYENRVRQEVAELIKTKEGLVDELQQIRQKIENSSQLANDVEGKVAERIQGAQQDAAEFISQMAFITPFLNSSNVPERSLDHNQVSVFKSTMSYTEGDMVDDLDTFEEELTENLMLTGYSDESAVEMAQVISFCTCNRLPIVVGENSTVLAQCVASTIGGEELTEIFMGSQPSVISSLYELMNVAQAGYPLVYLIHGVFDGYNINLFNEISNLLRKPEINGVVILSLQGIAPNMIINSVWARAFYIDGDSGIERLPGGLVHAVNPVMEFDREMDEDEYRARRKELKPFSSVLSNMQICWYARYLATYDVALQDSPMIINQIIAACRSNGSEEKLNALFHENGISNGEKMLEQHL